MSKSTWNIPKAIRRIETKEESLLKVAAAWLAGQSRRLSPTITGRLKNSISWSVGSLSPQDLNKGGGKEKASSNDGVDSPNDNLKAWIGTSVEYAPYVEFGTKDQMEQPFLRYALYSNKAQLLKFLGR